MRLRMRAGPSRAMRSARSVSCDCEFDAATGVARLVYAFDDGPELVETITLPGAPFALDGARAAAVERALRLLHLIAGVSYYKAAVPPEIRIEGVPIDAATAALLETSTSTAWASSRTATGCTCTAASVSRMRPTTRRAAPALGLQRARAGRDRRRQGFAGRHRSAARARRRADGRLDRRLAADQGLRRTHRPADAQHRPRAGAAAVRIQPPGRLERPHPGDRGEFRDPGVRRASLLGVDQVVFSNERSASYGSLIAGTGEVNHQWSKGWAFEQAFGEHVRAPRRRRPAVLLAAASAERTRGRAAVRAHRTATTRISPAATATSTCSASARRNRWCGVCPKCHFVFLALAPFMPKPRLVGIFGRNLLDDPAQAAGLRRACSNTRTTSPSNASAKAANRARRWPRWPRARSGARTRWSSASRARSGRSSMPHDLALEPLLALDDEHRIPPALWESAACASRSLTASASPSGAGAAKGARRIARCASRLPALPLTLFCDAREAGGSRGAARSAADDGDVDHCRRARGVRRRRQVARHQSVPRRSGRRRRAGHALHRRHRAVVRRARGPRPRPHDLRDRHQGQEHDDAPCSRTCCAQAAIAPRWRATSACRCLNCSMPRRRRRTRRRSGRSNCRATRPAMSPTAARIRMSRSRSTCSRNTSTGTAAKRATSPTSCAW